MKLKVICDGLSGTLAKVWIDDELVEDCASITLNWSANKVTTATVIRYVDHLEVVTEAETRWMPPRSAQEIQAIEGGR